MLEDARTVLFGLHQLPNIGWKTIKRLMNHLPSITQVMGMTSLELRNLGLTNQRSATIAEQLTPDYIKQRMIQYEAKHVQWVTVNDEEYPPLLRQIYDPPWVLYYVGDIRLLSHPTIAIVGTRTPTVYGKATAEQLAFDLSQSGICVVSGFARGIDSAAHRGALRASGSTAAILGHGLETIYPPENKDLFNEMKRLGTVVTEYPLHTKARQGMFPLRNRIIAGLSLGTVVVEAAEQSGSLITAELALNESRDIFSVPGPISSPKSRGALNLIKQGAAKLITCADDILEEYQHLSPNQAIHRPQSAPEADGQLHDDERLVIGLLTSEPTSIDQLLAETNFQFGHLHSVLLSLLMKKRIHQSAGSSYVLYRPYSD